MLERIKNVLSEFTEYPVDEMTEQSSLIADLGLDSLDVVNIAVAFEDEFDIEIPDRDIKNLTTIGKIQDYIQDRQKEE